MVMIILLAAVSIAICNSAEIHHVCIYKRKVYIELANSPCVGIDKAIPGNYIPS